MSESIQAQTPAPTSLPEVKEGLMGRTLNHLFGATCEPDGVTPSSARTFGAWIFTTVLFLQVLVIGVLCWRIFRLDHTIANAPALATIYTSVLKTFFLWSLLFDVATALSLYGINVWKYVAQIRTGVAIKDDGTDVGASPVPTKDQVVAVVTGKAPVVAPAPKAPSDASDDPGPSRVD